MTFGGPGDKLEYIITVGGCDERAKSTNKNTLNIN